MDIYRKQELIQVYDEKLSVPDSPRVFEMRFADLTADWIKSLNEADRANVFEYIGYILDRPGENTKKQRTIMMLVKLPCPETEKLMDKMLSEGTPKHTPFIMQYVSSIKFICNKHRGIYADK
jgi:hypothetical protein